MKPISISSSEPAQNPKSGGFTLVELFVVLGTIAVLASVLLPALAACKPSTKVMQCMNNKRELTLAWQMYSSDYADSLMTSTLWVSSRSFMDWTSAAANTNTTYFTNSSLSSIAGYNKNVGAFKCPADSFQSAANPGPRTRSVSMNISIGGSPQLGSNYKGLNFISAKKVSDLSKPGPGRIFAFLDEHPDSINDGIFAENAGYYPPGSETWRDYPASYHDGSCGISFADGHVEMHAWQVTSGQIPTTLPVMYANYSSFAPWQGALANSTDFDWIQDHMPYH